MTGGDGPRPAAEVKCGTCFPPEVDEHGRIGPTCTPSHELHPGDRCFRCGGVFISRTDEGPPFGMVEHWHGSVL